MIRWLRVLLASTLVAATGNAFAHATSTAYLELGAPDARPLPVQWVVALRDLDAVLDLDADGDGRLRWGEVTGRHAAIAALAREQVSLSAGGARCEVSFDTPRLARLDATGYAALAGRATCPQGTDRVRIDYGFLHGIDPSHRVLVRVAGQGSPRPLAPGTYADFTAGGAGNTAGAQPAARFMALFADGVAHIAGGPDHLLFLVALLLPAVLVRTRDGWRSRPALRPALIDVAWIATAFTLAHSITLALASFGLVTVPARIIEPLIAATVLAAALNNLKPVVTRRLAAVAFGFGLIHGFGFAEVLAPLGLPPRELALALFSFNLGVETGQLAIVVCAFTLLALARRWRGYPRWILGAGSTALALIASVWIVERVFDVPLFALAVGGA